MLKGALANTDQRIHDTDTATDHFLRAFETGAMLEHVWPRACANSPPNAGLNPPPRFHDLRNTCVALLVQQGAHARAIMEHLGHSSITVTMDTYGHVFPSTLEELAASLDDTYRATTDQPQRDAEVHSIGDLGIP